MFLSMAGDRGLLGDQLAGWGKGPSEGWLARGEGLQEVDQPVRVGEGRNHGRLAVEADWSTSSSGHLVVMVG